MECKEMICEGCNESKKIVNKHFGLCKKCNDSRLSVGKEKKIYKYIKDKDKSKTVKRTVDSNESKKKNIVDKNIKDKLSHKVDNSTIRIIYGGRRKGKSLQTILLDEIFYEECFNQSDHKCEECGKQLPTEFRDENGKVIARFRYSHIMAKSIAPQLRHNIKNINHLCLEHHTQWDFGNKKIMKIYKTNALRFPNYF